MAALSDPSQWLTLYGDTLYRHALFKLGDAMSAEEMVQETLLAALQARHSFAGQSSEKTWLMGILKHKIIDYLRKAVRERPVIEEQQDVDALMDACFDQRGYWKIDVSHWSQPDESLEHSQFWDILALCLDKLPKRLHALFMLRELDGMESDAICKELDISSTNNLWVMLSRMRMRLRECLGQHWFEGLP